MLTLIIDYHHEEAYLCRHNNIIDRPSYLIEEVISLVPGVVPYHHSSPISTKELILKETSPRIYILKQDVTNDWERDYEYPGLSSTLLKIAECMGENKVFKDWLDTVIEGG